MIKDYYKLIKPGIIYGNLMPAVGGFLFASHGNFIKNIHLFFATLVGLALIIACGCVFNNYLDRDIDALMKRTQNRALVTKVIPINNALSFAVILGVCGIMILYLQTNILTLMIALLGLFVYVILYTLWLKRSSIFATYVGSISGAVPIIVGYCAVTNKLDMQALLLFLILVIWQIPHSYAIGIRLLKDYTAAKINLLPIKYGVTFTKYVMLLFSILFTVAILSLNNVSTLPVSYTLIMGGMSIIWIILHMFGFIISNNLQWARIIFISSILIMMIFSGLLIFCGYSIST